MIAERNNQTSSLSDNLRQFLTSLGTSRRIEQDTFLFRSEMDAEEIYLIKSGLIKISTMATDGKGITLRICKADDIVGEQSLYTEEPKYLLNAQIIESGEVICVNIKQLYQELSVNHSLVMELIKWCGSHMQKNQHKLNDLLLNGKKGALYSTLIRLTNSYGIEHKDGILINSDFKDQDIADLCGATREYTNRMLGELRTKNVLETVPSGNILIKDIEYLKRENNCGDCPIEVCNIN